MSFRGTIFLFGLLLAMLWLFGLTVARQKTAVDASFLLPTLQASPDVTIDAVTIQRRVKGKEPETFDFTKSKDVWTLQVPGVHKSVKLESFRVDQMVRQIRDARRSDEAGVTNDLARYGLDQPSLTITLKGAAANKKEREWQFFVGGESPDQLLMYVNTSDRPNKVFGITKSSIDSVFFKDPNQLRARRLFEFSDSAAQLIDVKEGSAELTLKKGDDAVWRFEKPALGIAEFEGPPPPKNAPPGTKPSEGGVKGLLDAIATMRVDSEDDFVPLSNAKLGSYGLEPGKEAMRIEVGTVKDTLGKKETAKETLALGSRVPGQNQVYGRMVGDDGVFRLNAKLLAPIKNTLRNPGTLRSRDVATIDAKKVDAVVLTQNKETVTLLRPEGKPWDVQIGSAAPAKANATAIDALLVAAQGKGEIAKFFDGDDVKKLDAEMKSPSAVIAFYEKGLAEPVKDKKDAKSVDAPPKMRKDAKPELTLKFAGIKTDTVDVERVLADGTTSRFVVSRSAYDKIMPADIALEFLDNALPTLVADDISQIEITRAHGGIDIVKSATDNRWYFKDTGESANKSYTDTAKTSLLVNSLAGLSVKRWLRKVQPKDDLTKYGLKSPAITVTLHVRKARATTPASLVGLLATQSAWRGVMAGAAVLAKRQTDLGEAIVLKIGNEATDERDKPAHYALRGDTDMLFLLPDDIVRMVRDLDLHDRASVVSAESLVAAATLGLGADLAPLALVSASPLATNRVQHFDPAKVKEISLAIRTPQELRSLTFKRDGAAKTWRDLSGLKEFELDSQKVEALIGQLAALKASRWVNLAGGAKAEEKLTTRTASLRIEAVLENDRTVTLMVGAPFEQLGYYAQTSAMPEAVFLLAPNQVTPLMAGPAYFAKDKLASR